MRDKGLDKTFLLLFSEYQQEIKEWQDKTFPESTEETILKHLMRELEGELMVSKEPCEAADCALLLIAFANKRGFNLMEEILKKFDLNQTRKWGEPGPDGVREHIR